MRIAVPVVDGQLAQHFGHCEQFMLFEVDAEERTVRGPETVASPPHQPGLLPQWLKELGADVIIAGGMGTRAQELFARSGIEAIVGVDMSDPRAIAEQYLAGNLQAGENICDH